MGDKCSALAYEAAKKTFASRHGMFGEPVQMDGGFTGALDFGDFYLVQEYIQGESLDRLLKRKLRLDFDEVAMIVSQVGAGVSINVPWLNGKKYRAEEGEAQGEESAAQSELVSAQTEALGSLRNQLEKIETLHHHVELYRDNLLPTARQTVASYQADYEADKATLLILLSSQRNLRDLETMYYQDLSDYRVALAELESLVGLDHKASETSKPDGTRQR